MGWIGATVLGVVAILALAGCAAGWAYAYHPVALLDFTDRTLRGDGEIRVVEAIRYGEDPAQKLEVIVPANRPAAPLPIVVFVHGGGWDSGDPHDYRFMARALAPHGYMVVLAGYRLYPQSRYPMFLEDGAAAVEWVSRNAARLGGDPARMVLMGHSAGAYNVAMLALDRQWLGRRGLSADALKGVVGLSGPYDFLPLDTDMTRQSFGQAPDLPVTQPVNHARGDAPPLLLVTGDEDKTVRPRNSVALARAMTAAGRPTEVTMMPGVGHSGIIMQFAQPFARRGTVLGIVLPFLAKVTAPASAPVQPTAR